MKTIIFDLDGTLADIHHRRSYLKKDTPDWKKFNASMGSDTPNVPVVELYKTLWAANSYQLIIVSGRGEEYRAITEQWLVWNEIPFDILMLRQAGDFRTDAVVKREILLEIRARYGEVLFAVDDRQQVVDMWRENGVTCLQCAEGNF
ncbi:hypothetical protein ACLBWZ_09105 [Brucellaceae bacterium C25G]